MSDYIDLEQRGSAQHFECQVIGYPTPTIRWFKDDVEITKSDRIMIGYDEGTGVVTLAIKNLMPSDEGCYQCRAENSEGYATTTAYLVVTGAAPEDVLNTMVISELIAYSFKHVVGLLERFLKSFMHAARHEY
jgi:hypothetical protein